ncbi:hypothetical protein [Microbacterium sp. TPD7012]|uniref:hypothetical protein n=1 Tax=Microbacterium sp. TPD7012 TaxID=2171975 RepID=UPI000D509002|nr:hypothetical protein [Microbacterium sp. TPD7012]PVE98102.1 hypothetical protein DC434_01130 [Microbacterium sp. TPD7012]
MSTPIDWAQAQYLRRRAALPLAVPDRDADSADRTEGESVVADARQHVLVAEHSASSVIPDIARS